MNLFPGNGGLLRPEDGVALEDGRIIVSDQAKGLRLIEKDGSNRPFGNFAEVGFIHNPPKNNAAPNGLVLEHDGKHLLMCDVSDGKIYRTNVDSVRFCDQCEKNVYLSSSSTGALEHASKGECVMRPMRHVCHCS